MPEQTLHIHLVSDSTGETVHQVTRACLAQFADVKTIEHVLHFCVFGFSEMMFFETRRRKGFSMFLKYLCQERVVCQASLIRHCATSVVMLTEAFSTNSLGLSRQQAHATPRG